MQKGFEKRLQLLQSSHEELISKHNRKRDDGNGIYDRYVYPVLTAQHTPIFWRYDINYETNPHLLERFGINAVFNAGAIKLNGRYLVVARVEGIDNKSFFAVAESNTGMEHFTFWEYPVSMPQTEVPDTNIYDMRVVQHEDGWIYGLFCTERRDPMAPSGEQPGTVAQCGIARTKDLKTWERLSDLVTPSPQQRNVVLHPEFVNKKYAFYTRPQDSFLEAGASGGIGFGLSPSILKAVIEEEVILDRRIYHTMYEQKNGEGPPPLKTPYGWLHLAHGVRNTAAGPRYVLYMFMTDLKDLTTVTYKPAGYFIAPQDEERIGDVPNAVCCNGWILDEDKTVFIYYASSGTRLNVATTTLDKLLDYVMYTAPDGFSSAESVDMLHRIIDNNKAVMHKDGDEQGFMSKKPHHSR